MLSVDLGQPSLVAKDDKVNSLVYNKSVLSVRSHVQIDSFTDRFEIELRN